MTKRPASFWPGKGLLLILAAVTLLPGLAGWAIDDQGRFRKAEEGGEISEPAREYPFAEPILHRRPEELAALAGVDFDYDLRKLQEPGTLFTSTGVFRVADPNNQRGIPAGLRSPVPHPAPGAGLIRNGLNYVLLSPEGRRQAAAVEARLAAIGVRFVGLVRGGYILWVPAQGIGDFRNSDLFEAFSPLPPAHKIAADVGVWGKIRKDRAESRILDLVVQVVPGVEKAARVEKAILAHSESVRPLGEHFGLRRYSVRADAGRVERLAAIPWVYSIDEEKEFVTRNYEAVLHGGGLPASLGAQQDIVEASPDQASPRCRMGGR